MQNTQKLEAVHPDSVPYIVYESERARAERIIKRIVIALVITIILAISALYLQDRGWREFIAESDIETYTYEQGGAGVNIVGDSNGVDVDEPVR